MAFSMTRRERVILITTVVLAVSALVFNLGMKSGLGGLAENRELLKREKEKYDGFLSALKRRPVIEKRLEELKADRGITVRSDREFTPMIEEAFRDIGMRPDIRTPTYEFLYDGTKEYGRVTLRILCKGTVGEVGRMLVFFDEQLIEVNSMVLTSKIDVTTIDVDVTVSQIVELSDEMREKLRTQSTTNRGRPGPRPRPAGSI